MANICSATWPVFAPPLTAEAHSEEATSADRINIHQAIISLVDEAGRPLSTSEIRHRLIALRGVNEGFRIAAVDPLIRLGTAEWGLNDRAAA